MRESRIIADLMLREIYGAQWNKAILVDNVLQTRSVETARRLSQLIKSRLSLMHDDFWRLIRDGSMEVAVHATFSAAVEHSTLLGDFMDLVMRQEYRIFTPKLSTKMWEPYIEGCRGRDPEMPEWNQSTIKRLRSSVFQMLAEAGYLKSSRSLELQSVHFAGEVLRCLEKHNENYVLRCVTICS